MSGCDHPDCSDGDVLTMTCNYCERVFCTDHRLPEQHDCERIDAVQAATVGGETQAISQRELNRRERKANKRECAECSNYTTADHELCRDCRAKVSTSSYRSPEVRVDGTVDDGKAELEADGGSVESSVGLVTSAKYRLETGGIRVRSWVNMLTHAGAVSIFLLGLYGLFDARTLGSPELLGFEIPAMAGLTTHATYLYGSFIVMMLGLGLSYRWIISDRQRI